MEAVVLAAGKGERLWPLTETRPKPLLPVGDRPLIVRSLEALAHSGIREIVLVVNYKSEMVQKLVGNGSKIGCEVEYVKQKSPRGTADAVRTAQEKLSGNDRFLVMYGDDFFDREAVKSFVTSVKKTDGCTVGVSRVDDASPFGRIEAKDGLVTEIREKAAKGGPGFVNSGLYIMNQSIFSTIKKTARSKRGEFELTDSLNMLIKKGEPVYSEELRDSGWLGISYPWDLLDANEHVLNQENVRLDGTIEEGVQLKGSVVLEAETVVKSGSRIEGPVHVGKRCHIGPNAYLRAHTCLGDGVKVGAACEIKNSIVMAGTKIPHLSYVGDSVVGE